MTQFTPFAAMAGGALIGLAAVLLMWFNGRIAGISGIMNGVFSAATGDRLWRFLFVVGLIAGGAAYQWIGGATLMTREDFSLAQLVLAGLLVGFGTRLGSGCTSGHGVCGIARVSPRSLAATAVFMACGFAVATAIYRLAGGAA